ncbi:transposase-related (plasmid) [Sinorhizobium fredii HH103]|nr:hypothetical protein SFHH103_04352 [Sinorhizobium fredii HH103]CEO91493.1 transposase-related [Sinorhizobium fredii HH103]
MYAHLPQPSVNFTVPSRGFIGPTNLRSCFYDKELAEGAMQTHLSPRSSNLKPSALLLRHVDGAIGLFDRMAACFVDGRDRKCTVHSVRTLIGQRVAAIALA